VVKDAGDDPDVTDGAEIRASVTWDDTAAGEDVNAEGPTAVRIEGGQGVGRVTKPGLAVPVGEPAINPVPREMIVAAAQDALRQAGGSAAQSLRVVVSVPLGEEIARRTLNARLGILGGISILGTTGVVIPMSADAWRATLDVALDVARASGIDRVVLAHGRSSEAAAQAHLPELPSEAFVLMGDHVGYALEAAAARALGVILVGQFAKFCKVAAGSFETHVKDSTLELRGLAELLAEAGFSQAEVRAARRANTAREVFQALRAGGDRGVFACLTRRVARQAAERVEGRIPVEAVLFGYDKAVLAREGVAP
jgi:cobalt-precorrin-5B (C1)-methyltransferase